MHRVVADASARGSKPTLSWYDGTGSPRRLALSPHAGPLTIGRRDGNSVALTWDDEVSRAHAQLEPVGRDWTIRDDGLSRNGTWVNGARVRGSRRLSDGDTIRVGRTLLVVTMFPRSGSLPTGGLVSTGDEVVAAGTTVRLCGPFVFERGGERLERRMPRQSRVALAFLTLHRSRPVRRDELIDAIWPDRLPDDPRSSLHVILSRLRRVTGEDGLRGRGAVTLRLGPEAFVDVEVAHRRVEEAGLALGDGDCARALTLARQAEEIVTNPLLPDLDEHAWVHEQRHALDGLLVAALETRAAASLKLSGSQLPGAESAARELIRREPWHERGYALLLQTLIARGNAAAALLVFDQLRQKLRDELGVAPHPTTIAVMAPLLGASPT